MIIDIAVPETRTTAPVGRGAGGAPAAEGERGADVRKPPANPRWLQALEQVAGIAALTLGVFRSLLKPPLTWRTEFVEQAWLLAKRASIPLALSAFAFGYGAAGIQGALTAELIGSVERSGVVASTGSLREIAVWVTGMVVAGVAGSAICADLGARKVREELDALAVMGVDPVRTLIAPRVLALTLVMPALSMLTVVAVFLGSALAALQFSSTFAGFWEVFRYGFTSIDVIANVVKTAIFGGIVALVCCYKGMTAKGGSQGVGRAVNQAVVIAFVLIWLLNFAFNSIYQSGFPGTQVLR